MFVGSLAQTRLLTERQRELERAGPVQRAWSGAPRDVLTARGTLWDRLRGAIDVGT